MPLRLAVVTDQRGKSGGSGSSTSSSGSGSSSAGGKEQGNLVVKEAVQACMAHWEAPFR